MRKKRKIRLIKQENSRIFNPRTKEMEMVLDLARKADDIFFRLKNMAGAELDYDKVDEILNSWTDTMIRVSNSLQSIAERIEIDYIEPSSISINKIIMNKD